MSLTDDDKSWISAQLAIIPSAAWIEATFASAIADSETRTRAAIERVETSLLTEFHKWASPAGMRATSHALTIRALDLEMENLGERVTRLEPPR